MNARDGVQAAFDRRHNQFLEEPITAELDEERETIIADAPFGD